MKRLLILAIVVLALTSCEKLHVEKDSNNAIMVSTDDQEMNAIIDDARATVAVFLERLSHPKPNQTDFSVKYPFKTDPGSSGDLEHIWLSNIVNKEGKYFGTVANDPDMIKSMKLGDVVAFDPQNISDWKYEEDNVLVGGKSIIFMLKNLSQSEREEVLKDIGYQIPGISDKK